MPIPSNSNRNRNSGKRTQYEKAFAHTRGIELQKHFVDYLSLRKEQLIQNLLKSSGEDAIFLRGELSAIIKLIKLLQAEESL